MYRSQQFYNMAIFKFYSQKHFCSNSNFKVSFKSQSVHNYNVHRTDGYNVDAILTVTCTGQTVSLRPSRN